ncbi:hypothetical protein [Pseudomonas sp. D1-2]|uniref:hypothetical protein n=1 Tax=unclassified Pseudomonas TaxID=196821 RepID=UPI003DA8384F
METDDKNNEAEGASANETVALVTSEVVRDEGLLSIHQIIGRNGNYYAILEVEVVWSDDGARCTVNTLRYWALGNGREKGNIHPRLVSKVDTDWEEILHEGGNQNGQWHDFPRTKRVEGNARSVFVDFSFIYDRDNVGDVNLTGDVTVEYKVPMPRMNEPRDGQTVLPNFEMSGTGIHRAEIHIHREGSGQVLADPVTVTNGSWRASLLQYLHPGRVPITCRQLHAGLWSPWIPAVNVTVHFPGPTISAPGNGETVGQRPRVSGSGENGATV